MNDFQSHQPTTMPATTCFVARADSFGVDSHGISRVDVGLVGKTWKPALRTWEGDSATEVKVTRH